MRPRQWAKNALVFAGYLFTIGQHHSSGPLVRVLLAFCAFCAVSSATYILNDILDVDRDKRHPKKCKRPIASGQVPVKVAALLSLVLLAVGMGLGFWLDWGGSRSLDSIYHSFVVVMAAYLTLTVSYSIFLKHIVIIDLLAVAGGFVLRAVAGAVAIHVPISTWFLLCTSLLALFVGLAKRRHEIITLDSNAGRHRKILEDYSPELLDQMMNITAASALMTYSLYTFTATNLSDVQHRHMMGTIPFVIYGIFRYLFLVHKRDAGGEPEQLFIGDRPLLVNVILWAGAVALVLGLGGK